MKPIETYCTKAGWYIVIHNDYDTTPEITGPFSTVEEAYQELKEILACSLIPHSSSQSSAQQS